MKNKLPNVKTTVFSSIVFLFAWAGKMDAQNAPFPDGNAVWKEAQTTIAGPVFHHFALCGDTIMAGNTYSQVHQLLVDSALNVVGSSFLGGLRSNGNIVRILPVWSSQEFELYNFGLQEGDVVTLFSFGYNEFVARLVDSVRTEDIAGKLRRVIYFHPSQSWMPVERWMEGIGSSYGLLGRATEPGTDLGFDLLCFQHGLEYHNETLIECFLPTLPGTCATLSDDKEPLPPIGPLALTARPNPAGPDVRFEANHPKLPEPCELKIYAANGKLLATVPDAQPSTALPAGTALPPGFYIATLESQRTGRRLAHCTFMVGK
jgi:hypothetical protein